MAKKQKQLSKRIELLFEAKDKNGLKALLAKQRTSDIAEVVELVDNEKKRAIFDLLDAEVAAEVLEKVEEATRAELFDILEDEEFRKLIHHLDADDAADILSELPAEESAELLKSIPPAESAQIKDLMSYSEDSAGGIMDPVLISVQEDATVAQAVNEIRSAEIDEDFYSVFVINQAGQFVGDVRIRSLLISPENSKISNLINPDIISVAVNTDQEEVRNLFSKNDLIVVPVVDKNKKLVGRITADRIIEVAEEEAAEDLYTMAGTEPEELDDVSIFRAARIRMTWLVPCLIGTGVTALVMMFFYNINKLVYIAAVAFVPMIAALSGNAGLQTSTIVVSGLATGHLAAMKLRQVFVREVRIAFLVAVCCGILGGLACVFLLHIRGNSGDIPALRLMFAFGASMFAAIMVATTLGLFLPFLFRGVGIDPAISSGPLVTTANDSISVAIYMTFALLLAGYHT